MRPSEIALTYVGQTEKPGNMGFNDADFDKKMKAVGFSLGQAWCSYFCELVFKAAYPERFAELDKLFSAGTVQTFRNFRDAAYLIGNIPQKDCMVIWQTYKSGKPQITGHCGVVDEWLDNQSFFSIEGNTNHLGGREGFEVARKLRKVMPNVKDGLKILGFVHIPPVTTLNV